MVGKRPRATAGLPIVPREREIDTDRLGERLAAAPGFASVAAAAATAGAPVHIVGGAVRDALLGRGPRQLDLVVEGDPSRLIEALGGDAVIHDRFETAAVRTPAGIVDVARARAEAYPRPGALPEVRPADLAEDLGRRDFTVNALAVRVVDPGSLLDPFGGADDLRAGLLRVLHPGSFTDDPTRALRAARYASRLELELEPRTAELLRATDLDTVSRDRVEAELGRLAEDEAPRRGFELLDGWGLVELPAGAGALIGAVADLLEGPEWAPVASRREAVLAAARGGDEVVRELAAARPTRPSEGVAAARGRSGVELALARALGAEWLDRYVDSWREVRPAISGDELIAAGIAEGPAVGRGLAAALRAKLDGEAESREDELQIALDAAGS